MRTLLFLAISTAIAASALAQTPPAQPQPEAQAPATPPAAVAPADPAVPAPPAEPPMGQEPAQLNRVAVELESTQGNRVRGELLLSPDNHGLRITGTLTGLSADSAHGFHVHQNGDCSAPDASSAGDHFNPAGVAHGNPSGDEHHAGDMPNLQADDEGNAEVDLHIKGLTLGDGGDNDILGKALVVHADPDDYTTDPAGNAGARVACGVISAPPAPGVAPTDADEDDADSAS